VRRKRVGEGEGEGGRKREKYGDMLVSTGACLAIEQLLAKSANVRQSEPVSDPRMRL